MITVKGWTKKECVSDECPIAIIIVTVPAKSITKSAQRPLLDTQSQECKVSTRGQRVVKWCQQSYHLVQTWITQHTICARIARNLIQ